MEKQSKILITGASGVVGTALVEVLNKLGYSDLITPGSSELDLLNYTETKEFFIQSKPDYVFHLAGRIYGIMGNMKNKAKSYFENTLINTHVIESTRLAGAKKIVAMGTVAIYPDPPPRVPYMEDDIFLGPPHHSEDSYAHSKRSMLAQLKAYKESYGLEFVYAISTNLYGPNDRFSAENGHVIPSLIRKFYEAKQNGAKVIVWGTGLAERDFLYSKDAARALISMMEKGAGEMNLASGHVAKIKDVVEILAAHCGMADKIEWDTAKPNGQMIRSYNVSRLSSLGFVPEYSLNRGLKETFDWYSSNQGKIRLN